MTRELSARELEVIHLVAVGNTNQQVANALGVTVGTIRMHMHNILLKYGVTNRGRAAFIYMCNEPSEYWKLMVKAKKEENHDTEN